MKLETKETKSERPHDTVVNGVDSTAERAGFQSQLAYVLLGDEGELLHVTVPHSFLIYEMGANSHTRLKMPF